LYQSRDENQPKFGVEGMAKKHEPVSNRARKYTDESRAERKDRLQACGEWKNFVHRRYALQDEGYDQVEASKIADAEFRHFGEQA
jgi:hypothetical protein